MLMVAGMLVLSYAAPDTYRQFAREDGPVEYLTFFGLLAVSLSLVWRYFSFRQNQGRVWKLLTLSVAAIFIFAAGEEISWGQRIFGWQTGEAMASLNSQGETNLHNLQIGEVKLNKLIFTYGLGLVVLGYFLVLPLVARRSKAFQHFLAKVGVPLSRAAILVWFVLAALAVLAIPHSNKWEVLEATVPLVALAVLFDAFPQEGAGQKQLLRAGLQPG